MEIEQIEIRKLKGYEKNSKTHPAEQIDKIAKSINEFGFNVPVLIDKENVLIAGHGRVLAAKKLGLPKIPVMRLEHLNAEQIKAYRIADNKTAESDWEWNFLKEEMVDLNNSGYDLALTGFDKNELDELFGVKPEIQEVEADDPNKIKTDIKIGDLFKLGNHRLLCGDATDYKNIELLTNKEKIDMCFTDPPYNTGMQGSSQTTRLSGMFNDKFTDAEWEVFLNKFVVNIFESLKNNSVAYICLDWRRNHELVPVLKNKGFHISNIIVWDKMVHGLGSDYKYTYELINVAKKGTLKLDTHKGEREYSDVWHIQRKMGKDDDHATKKPIELCARAISHVTCDTVIDIFGGSGSTMLACEQINRTCYMMELDPIYCQVIINRWEKLTNKKAERVL